MPQPDGKGGGHPHIHTVPPRLPAFSRVRSMDMDKRESTDRPAVASLRDPAQSARDSWLDRALEDSFPASDPVAAHQFD
jgi:hypothetical protein